MSVINLNHARMQRQLAKTKASWALGHVELAIENLQTLKDVKGVPTAILQLQRLQRQLAAVVNKK